MLMRLDLPGMRFPDLEVRFHGTSGTLEYQGSSLERLLAWNDVPVEALHQLTEEETYMLLCTVYAQWRSQGGEADSGIERAMRSGSHACARRLDAVSRRRARNGAGSLRVWLRAGFRAGLLWPEQRISRGD